MTNSNSWNPWFWRIPKKNNPPSLLNSLNHQLFKHFQEKMLFFFKNRWFLMKSYCCCVRFFSSKEKNLVLRLVSVQIVREKQLNSCSNHSKSWVLGSPAAVNFFVFCNEKKVGAVVKGKWHFFVWRDYYFLTFLKKKYTFSLEISDFWWNRIASIFGIFFLKDKNYVLQFISAQNVHENLEFFLKKYINRPLLTLWAS